MFRPIIVFIITYVITSILGAPVVIKSKEQLHEPLHEPGSLDQLLEAWEEEDGMSPQNFDAKLFFLMHDLDGNKELSPEEVDVILEREMEKLHGNATHTNQTYVAQVVKEMRDYFIQQYDRNRDGKISMNEFLTNPHHSTKQNSEEWVPHEDKLLEEELRRQEQLAKAREQASREAHHRSQNDEFRHRPNDNPSAEQRHQNIPANHDPQQTVLDSHQPRADQFGSPQDHYSYPELHPGIQPGQHSGGGHFPQPGSFNLQPPHGHPEMHAGLYPNQVGQQAMHQVVGNVPGSFGSPQPNMQPEFQPQRTGQNTGYQFESQQPQHPGIPGHPGGPAEQMARQPMFSGVPADHIPLGGQFASQSMQPGIQQGLHPGQHAIHADASNSQDHLGTFQAKQQGSPINVEPETVPNELPAGRRNPVQSNPGEAQPSE